LSRSRWSSVLLAGLGLVAVVAGASRPLGDVLPRAIQKHGGWTPDALAAAARETDIPEGGTMQGYGVKFFPPGSSMAGQNERAFPAVYQVQDGKFALVYPKTFASTAPVLPFPASSPFAAR